MSITILLSFSEILLLVNLSVALANAYITSLPVSVEETRSEASPLPQQTGAVKKGAKGDQQPIGTTTGLPGSAASSIKNEDVKSALEVNHFI